MAALLQQSSLVLVLGDLRWDIPPIETLLWSQRPSGNTMQLLKLPLPSSVLRTLLRFRMGCHRLPNLTGSWAGVPRGQRMCSLCGSHSPDERHVVFECPALQHLRAEHNNLFQGRYSMRGFMWQPGAVQVAKFVAACLEAMTVDA